MLVLSRTEGQQIVIGDNIVITVVRGGRRSCRIGVDAPVEVPIRTKSLPQEVKPEAGQSS